MAMVTLIVVELGPDIEANDMNGIWQLKEKAKAENGDTLPTPPHYTFILDRDTVVLRLFSLSALYKQSDDGIYRLKARFEKDKLNYKLPLSEKWVELAKFAHDHFYAMEQNEKWVYERINADQIVDWNRDMLTKNRPLFNQTK